MRFRKGMLTLVCWAILSGWAGRGETAEQEKTVDSILEKWEQASRKCKTLDVVLERLYYSPFGDGRAPEIRQGRFYFESPDQGRFEMRSTAKVDGTMARTEEVYIWQRERLLWIEPPAKHYTEVAASLYPEIRKLALEMKDASFWRRLGGGWISSWLAQISRPEGLLPFVVNIDAKDLRRRFEISYEDRDGKIWLTAVAKKKRFRIILDPDTYLTQAIEFTDGDGSRVVYLLSEIKVNETPKDRDQLMLPDLTDVEDFSPALEEEFSFKPK